MIPKPTSLVEPIPKSTTETTSRDGNGSCESTKTKTPVKLQQPTKTGDLSEENNKKLSLSKTSKKNGTTSSKDVKTILLPEDSPQINYKLVQSANTSENTQISILNANQEGNQKKILPHLHLKQEEETLVKPITSANQAILLENQLKDGKKNYNV